MEKRPPALPLRIARVAAKGVVGLLLLVVTLLVAVLVAVNVPPTERFIIGKVNGVLASSFKGRVQLEHIGTLDLFGVRHAHARVFGPGGEQVLDLRDVNVALNLPRLAWGAVFGKGPLVLDFEKLELGHADVLLREDPSGALTIQTAFEPQKPEPPGAPPGRPVEVHLRDVRIGHAWVHGGVAALPVIDGELRGLLGSMTLDSTGTHLDVAHVGVDTRAMPSGANPHGVLRAELHVPSAPERGLGAAATFAGRVARLETRARVALHNDFLTAHVLVPRAEPAQVRELVATAPLTRPASVLISAQGFLPVVDVSADVEAGDAAVRIRAAVRISPVPEVNGRILVDAFDATLVGGPATKASLTGEISARQPAAGKLTGSYALRTAGSRVLDFRVPALTAAGTFTDASASAKIASQEAGVNADLAVTLTPDAARDAPGRADFTAHVAVADLQRIALIPNARGKVDVRAKGTYGLSAGDVTAEAQVAAHGVQVATLSVGSASAGARVTGSAQAPVVSATAKLANVTAAGQRFPRAELSATGPVAALRVSAAVQREDDLRLRAAATVGQGSLLIRDVDAELRHKGERVEARAQSIRVEGSRVDFTGVHVSGIGELRASGSVSSNQLRVRASATDIDLAAVGRLADAEQVVQGGSVSLNADVRGNLAALHGSVSTSVRDLRVAGLSGSSADVMLQVEGRTIDGTVRASLADAGRIELGASDLKLAPGKLNEGTLARTTGEITIDTEVDLERLALLMPEGSLPFDRASGKLALRGRITRKTPTAVPDLSLQAKTHELELVGKGSPEPIDDRAEAKRRKAWRVKEVNATIALDVTGSTGQTRLEARAFDGYGTLVELRTESTLPRAVLTARGDALTGLLWTVPVEAELRVPERELSCLPMAVRPAGIVGNVGGTFKARGTAQTPELELAALGRGLRAKDPSFRTPIDVTASVNYKDDRTRITIDANRNGKGALVAHSEIDGNLRRLLGGPSNEPAFRASADVRLDAFPLQTIPQLKERLVVGNVSGQLLLTELGRDAKLRVNARVDKLELGQVKNQTVLLDISAGAGKLTSQVELRHAGGFLRAKVGSGMAWGKRLVPELDHASETRAEVTANDYRIGSFQPFVAEQVSALDGRLDARLLSRSSGGKTAVEGRAELRDGVLQIPAIGQEFRDIRAQVTAAPGGLIKVEHVQLRGRQGRVRAAASARLEGLRLRTARAKVGIVEGEKLPLTTQGVELGSAWGTIDTTLVTSADGKTTNIDVKASELHLELPDTKQHNVQALDDAQNIRIGVRVDPKSFHALPLQPLEEPAEKTDSRTIIVVTLGRVWVHQGTTLDARLAGKLRVELTDEARVAGTIRIPRGKVDVSGKMFEIEQGTITFQPNDPANPVVVATARYDSPDGTRVYADFLGPVKTGKLHLRSQPPLSEDQILSLLLFGDKDGSFGSGGSGSDAATAVSVGGAQATQGLNAALGDVTDLDVTTRVDTSRGSPTPELVIQLTRRLSAEIGHYLGNPGLGQAPDRTFVTLDFRIRRRWSLATTVGDQGGTSVDAIWRHRY